MEDWLVRRWRVDFEMIFGNNMNDNTSTYIIWLGSQVVKTPPFHGGNTGSNPVRVTVFYLEYIN